MSKYLALDVETGGLNAHQHTLLTAYFLVLDENFKEVANLSLKLKPYPGNSYSVETSALKINKINLVEHDAEALEVEEAQVAFIELLSRYTSRDTKGEVIKLTPIGHNVAFDVGFLTTQLIQKEYWDAFVGYRTIDTATIAQFLKFSEKLPKEVSGSLGPLSKYLEVDFSEGEYHTAEGDVKLTLAVLEKFKQLVNQK